MNKKVCHMTSVHKRYDIRICLKECISLAKNGYDVTLIVNDCKEDEVFKNVKIVSTGFEPKNRLDRIFNSNKYIYEKAIKVDADIYHFHDPELIPVGNKIKKNGKIVILDSHEDVPNDIQDKKWIPRFLRNIIAKTYEIYEKKSAQKYDAVITVTPFVKERFFKINKNTVMITNYPIIDIDNEVERNPSNNICYAGAVCDTWNHDKIIMAINKIEDLEYMIAGKSTDEYIKFLQDLPGWKKVKYVGEIPHSEVNEIYSQSIAGMALNYCNQLRKGGGTLGNNKLFEYMYAKLPVICTNYKLWKEIVEKYQCGICIDPNNIDEIEKAIKYLINNPEKAKKMGDNGRRAVIEKYNWNTQEHILLDLYKNL